jgi:hypothetical protein
MLVSERSWKARFLEAKVLAPGKHGFQRPLYGEIIVFRMSGGTSGGTIQRIFCLVDGGRVAGLDSVVDWWRCDQAEPPFFRAGAVRNWLIEALGVLEARLGGISGRLVRWPEQPSQHSSN